jgi:hypothetical protein
MATATKVSVQTSEFVLTLTNTEANELAFYLAQRGSAYNNSTALAATNRILDALRLALR